MVEGSLNPHITFLGENCDQRLDNKMFDKEKIEKCQ